MKDKKLTGFTKDKACSSNLIVFYDKTMGFTGEKKGVDVVCSEPLFAPAYKKGCNRSPSCCRSLFLVVLHIPCKFQLQLDFSCTNCVLAYLGNDLSRRQPPSTVFLELGQEFLFFHVAFCHSCSTPCSSECATLLLYVQLSLRSNSSCKPFCPAGLSHMGSCQPDPWPN